MWTCPLCTLQFVKSNQLHSCGDKQLSDFLNGKPQQVTDLFFHLVNALQEIGTVSIHPTKSMISFASRKRFAYVIKVGKAFIDVVLPLKSCYTDNLCFNSIKPVPGSDDFNHHLRLHCNEDVNEEVRKYLKLAYQNGR